MKLTNDFTIAVPIDEAWKMLTDLERVAPCVPGFSLTGQDGDEFTGTMKVKVGAVSVSYDARIRFVDRNDETHLAVMEATAREKRGQGEVKALITSNLKAADGVTEVSLESDIDVTGRVASFGRGILSDVSNRLVGVFVGNVEASMVQPQEAPAVSVNGATRPTREAAPSTAANEPLNLVAVAGAPALRRAAPVLLVLLAAVLLGRRARNRG
jgi:carbon monoxide dehydrogenase subunit G